MVHILLTYFSTGSLTHFLAHVLSLAHSLAHPLACTLTRSLNQSGKNRISNPVCCMQIRVPPTLPSALDASPHKKLKTDKQSCILGKIAAGNLKLYLPFLLKEIQANPKRQYLLLHSLKEVCKNVFIRSGRRRCTFPYLFSDVFYSPPESLPTLHCVLHNVILGS